MFTQRNASSGKLKVFRPANSNSRPARKYGVNDLEEMTKSTAVQRSKSLNCPKASVVSVAGVTCVPYYRSRRHNSSQNYGNHRYGHENEGGDEEEEDDEGDEDEEEDSYQEQSNYFNLNTSSHKLFYEFMNASVPGTSELEPPATAASANVRRHVSVGGGEHARVSEKKKKNRSSSTDTSGHNSMDQVYRYKKRSVGSVGAGVTGSSSSSGGGGGVVYKGPQHYESSPYYGSVSYNRQNSAPATGTVGLEQQLKNMTIKDQSRRRLSSSAKSRRTSANEPNPLVISSLHYNHNQQHQHQYQQHHQQYQPRKQSQQHRGSRGNSQGSIHQPHNNYGDYNLFGSDFNFDPAAVAETLRRPSHTNTTTNVTAAAAAAHANNIYDEVASQRSGTTGSGSSGKVHNNYQQQSKQSSTTQNRRRSKSVYRDSEKDYQKLIKKSSPRKFKKLHKFCILKQESFPPMHINTTTPAPGAAPEKPKKIHRVLILGYAMCGKTSLLEQFYECKSSLLNTQELGSFDHRDTIFLHFCEAEVEPTDLGWLMNEYKADVYIVLFSISCR